MISLPDDQSINIESEEFDEIDLIYNAHLFGESSLYNLNEFQSKFLIGDCSEKCLKVVHFNVRSYFKNSESFLA